MLQVIGKWMKNPNSGGNVLAIQGPMGNGKTTLVKEGISKVLNRPFHFINSGGGRFIFTLMVIVILMRVLIGAGSFRFFNQNV